MRTLVVPALLALGACGPQLQGPSPRPVGSRSPLPVGCDAQDATRCLLPWPNNAFTVKDDTSPTGLRLAVERRWLPSPDSPGPLNQLDGFPVVGALAVGFDGPVQVATGPRRATAMRLFRATKEGWGDEVPLRLSVQSDSTSAASLLIGYPLRPLAYDTDYVAVTLDEVTSVSAARLPTPRRVEVALGLQPPADDGERALVAYHAPTRQLLEDVGVEARRVLRVWDFTTRSAQSVRAPFEAMREAARAAVSSGGVSVAFSSARPLSGGALELRGVVQGLPRFVDDAGSLGPGLPSARGTHEAPLRVVLPPAQAPFPFVVYGHGTGGAVNDDTFDADIVAAGAGKLNLEFAGWTETSVLDTLVGLDKRFTGSERSTARLLQSLADASALHALLDGALGEALAAPTFLGIANPAAGQRNDPAKRVYAGGSLGGTMGYVHALTEPRVAAAVLNVPGAGWTHFVPTSDPFSALDALFGTTTPSALDRALSVVMSQGSWDAVDGAAWAATGVRPGLVALVQQSMGDPILPNIGTHLVATSANAVQIGAVLEPVEGVARQPASDGRTGLTQFRISNRNTNPIDRHGFGGRSSTAGRAAREQIRAFFDSVWRGAPRITVPPLCTRGGLDSCDFGDEPP
ncbi:MAG: hypothetical protein JNJ54_04350 [Myxococcaceae bacterium]|nr:hypothetical protein [Myxococcaceae bacterium]